MRSAHCVARQWTQAEMETVRRLLGEGNTVGQAAKAIGRTKKAVQNKLDKERAKIRPERSTRRTSKAWGTLCWSCGRPLDPRSCPWMDRFEPVNGWDAMPTVLQMTGNEGRAVASYKVRGFPLLNAE